MSNPKRTESKSPDADEVIRQFCEDHYTVPALQAYIERIGAEQRSFKYYVVFASRERSSRRSLRTGADTNEH
jgi:hypothetical protein